MQAFEMEGPLAIKTCQETIGHAHKQRKGMFRMDEEEHRRLLDCDGHYLFGVEMKGYTKLKLIRASDIFFTHNISWTTVFQ